MKSKQVVSLITAKAFLQTFLTYENDHFQRVVSERAIAASVSKEDLEDLVDQISQKIIGVQLNGDFENPALCLPEEFSLFFSWVMSDMAKIGDSWEFNLKVQGACSEIAIDLGCSPADHRIFIVGWVIGQSTSKTGSIFPATFPEYGTSTMSEDATLAFAGLLEHSHFIETDNGNWHKVSDAEMALTSIPIRVMGLAEALLRPDSGNTVENNREVLRSAIQGIKSFTPDAFSRVWREKEVEDLVRHRDAVAHVWISDSSKPSLKEVIANLDSDYLDSLFALSTYIVAGVVVGTLKDTSAKTASHWFNATIREVENIWA